MDRTEKEIIALEDTVKHVAEDQVRELSDLQLALVGGGSGDTILH